MRHFKAKYIIQQLLWINACADCDHYHGIHINSAKLITYTSHFAYFINYISIIHTNSNQIADSTDTKCDVVGLWYY